MRNYDLHCHVCILFLPSILNSSPSITHFFKSWIAKIPEMLPWLDNVAHYSFRRCLKAMNLFNSLKGLAKRQNFWLLPFIILQNTFL